jgi:hypothetical protein
MEGFNVDFEERMVRDKSFFLQEDKDDETTSLLMADQSTECSDLSYQNQKEVSLIDQVSTFLVLNTPQNLKDNF